MLRLERGSESRSRAHQIGKEADLVGQTELGKITVELGVVVVVSLVLSELGIEE